MNRRRWLAVLVALAAVFAGGGAPAVAKQKPVVSAGTVLGDYAVPLVGAADADGVKHIDTAATIAKLTGAHVNTYSYLIYKSPLYGTASEALTTQAQWNDLPGFADAAAAAGIDVYVYLVPPTESTQTGYKPYGWDYKAWANGIATVATAHPNILGFVMDDFAANTREGGSTKPFMFTPGYVGQMMTSARTIASWLKFRAILYYPNYVGVNAVLPAYRPYLDGVIFPYRVNTPGQGWNTTDSSLATSQGGVVGAMAKCHTGGKCAQIEYPKNTPSTGGYYGAVKQTVSVSGTGTKTLTFWQTDDYNSTTTGYHYLQALVDNTVVWQSDVAASSNGLWHKQTVDVTSALAGKTSATLTLRVWDAHGVSNFHATGWFDDVAGSGFTVADGGFENPNFAPWQAVTNTGMFTVALVPSMDYQFMTYATKFSTEPAPTTATYVRSVVGQALAMIDAGVVDGSMIYCLNLTGADDGRSEAGTYDAVADLYGTF